MNKKAIKSYTFDYIVKHENDTAKLTVKVMWQGVDMESLTIDTIMIGTIKIDVIVNPLFSDELYNMIYGEAVQEVSGYLNSLNLTPVYKMSEVEHG